MLDFKIRFLCPWTRISYNGMSIIIMNHLIVYNAVLSFCGVKLLITKMSFFPSKFHIFWCLIVLVSNCLVSNVQLFWCQSDQWKAQVGVYLHVIHVLGRPSSTEIFSSSPHASPTEKYINFLLSKHLVINNDGYNRQSTPKNCVL